jgi:hypothetical protein
MEELSVELFEAAQYRSRLTPSDPVSSRSSVYRRREVPGPFPSVSTGWEPPASAPAREFCLQLGRKAHKRPLSNAKILALSNAEILGVNL